MGSRFAVAIGLVFLATAPRAAARSFRATDGSAGTVCATGGRCQLLLFENFVERGPAPKRHGFVCGIKSTRRNGSSARGPDASLAIVLDSSGRVRCVDKGRVTMDMRYNFLFGGPGCGVPTFRFTSSPGNAARMRPVGAAPGPLSSAVAGTVGTVVRNGKLVCVVVPRAELLPYDPRLADVPSLSEIFACGRIGSRMEGYCSAFDVDPATRCGVLRGCAYSDDAVCGVTRPCALPDLPVCY